MKPEDVQAILDTAEWEKIGEGAYNTVYKSKTELDIGGHKQYWVKKVPKESTHALSAPTRAVRKWNTIHTAEKDKAYLAMGNVWVAPYFGATEASSEAIAGEVLRLYRDTRQLILDASTPYNFLWRTDGAGGGEVKCIDVDYTRERRSSIISRDPRHWASEFELECYYDSCLSNASDKQPITSLLRTLIHIEKYLRPEDVKNEYLTPDILSRVRIFRIYKIPLTVEIMEKFLSLSKDELPAYYKKSIYLHFMNVADIALTDENRKPPAGLTLAELENYVKRLKFPSLRVEGMDVCDRLIESFLDKVPLTKLSVFVSRAHYLQSKVKPKELEDSDLSMLLELLQLDEEKEIPDGYLLEFITKGKKDRRFIVALAAELCLPKLLIRMITSEPDSLKILDQHKRTLLIIAASSGKPLGSRSDVIDYLVHKKIPINHQVLCSNVERAVSDAHNGLTALDYVIALKEDGLVIRERLRAAGAKTRDELRACSVSTSGLFSAASAMATNGVAPAAARVG